MGFYAVLVVGEHGIYFTYLPRWVDIGDIEWDERIFHPETLGFGFIENEEHPLIGGERLPEHQTIYLILSVDREFKIDGHSIDSSLNKFDLFGCGIITLLGTG
jgi:hypothetical protein